MTAKKTTPAVPEGALTLYSTLVKTIPGLEQKGASLPYTSVNGNMFSFLAPDGSLALRLGKTEREAFLQKFKTGLKEQHGTVLKEYVAVPDTLFKKIAALKPYFGQSYVYAGNLKPKAAKKQNP